MESYQFYKSLYDRELNRRKDLDTAVNLPLTILSIIIAANSYIVKENTWTTSVFQQILQKALLVLVSAGIGISIFYLTRSYNNFFKGFAYRNFGLTSAIRKYECNDLPNYNKRVDDESKLNFEGVIIDKLTSVTDDHIIFNDKRSHDLYLARTFLILCILFTAINFIVFSIKYVKI